MSLLCLIRDNSDRGSEFTDPLGIEFNGDGERRTRIFYCDPQRSNQKGGCEVCHEMIRRVLPKKTSFDNLTQDDVSLVMSHINSYTRKKLNNQSANQLFSFLYGGDTLARLGIKEIPANEINLTPFESVLNSLIRMKNVDVYVTGSNARFLSKDVITEFRGRGDEVHMHPLSFAEFMSVYSGTKQDGWNEYMLYGGLPPIMNISSPEEKISFLKSLFEETYISDIVGRHNVRKRAELEELLNILSSAIGSLTNPTKLSAAFKSVKQKTISNTTIKRYIDYLCYSFLIDSAVRYDIKGKKYIDTPVKYYFTDLGLRNARLNFRQLEGTHAMENIIFNELKIRDFNVDVGVIISSQPMRFRIRQRWNRSSVP